MRVPIFLDDDSSELRTYIRHQPGPSDRNRVAVWSAPPPGRGFGRRGRTPHQGHLIHSKGLTRSRPAGFKPRQNSSRHPGPGGVVALIRCDPNLHGRAWGATMSVGRTEHLASRLIRSGLTCPTVRLRLAPPPADERDPDTDQRDDRTEDGPGGGVGHRTARDRPETLQREQ